ncbi:MAG: GNAT family N-acetyltransferase [Candidatus Electryoneaceae bacterium]|nr:GNAT family N-acetyltransferase [Candidatus Electryoneaceae bacterium]
MSNNFTLKTVETKQEWNGLFDRCREVDIMQTWEYGDSVSNCIGWEPVRQIVSSNDEPVAMVQTLTKEIPVVGWVARMQHGPMFIGKSSGFDPSDAVEALTALHQYWIGHRKMTLHMTPCLLPSDLPQGWEDRVGVKPSDELLWASIRIDLNIPAETLLKNMKRRWRNPLRKAEKAGLQKEICTNNDDFDFFLDKYHQATVEKGIAWPSADLVHELWNNNKSAMRIIFARKDGERIAAMLPIVYASTGYALVAWNGPKSSEFHAHNFLIWQSILYYQSEGYRWFDLGGIDPEGLPGITKYKRGLQGEEYQFIGNYEARPAGASYELSDHDYRKGLGHILLGLDLPAPERPNLSDPEVVRTQVEAIISEFIRKAYDIEVEMDSDLSLIEGGLIDSLSLISVVQVLQDAFGVELFPQDITIENFDRIQAICSLISSKLEQL